ncbi:hypothetical protein PFISCL1PPCAC_9730, partial [Pristionchus fissidentatus]
MSKHIMHCRDGLSKSKQCEKRQYSQSKNTSSDSLDTQQERLNGLATLPLGSSAYRSTVEDTRKFRLILLKENEFDDQIRDHQFLFNDPDILISDIHSNGSLKCSSFENSWETALCPKLLSIGEEDEDLDLDNIRREAGGDSNGTALLLLLNLVNRSVAGLHRKAKTTHLFNHFQTQTTVHEAAESLNRAKTPYPSLLRIGSQATVMVYIGDLVVPTPSFARSLLFIVSLLYHTKLNSPRPLARLYNFVKVLIGVKRAHTQDCLFTLHSQLLS